MRSTIVENFDLIRSYNWDHMFRVKLIDSRTFTTQINLYGPKLVLDEVGVYKIALIRHNKLQYLISKVQHMRLYINERSCINLDLMETLYLNYISLKYRYIINFN